MIKKLLLVLLVLALVIAGLFAFAFTKPDDFQISRSTTVAAPAPVVFEQVNNLKKWHQWSPWAKLDPNMKLTYAGPESGKDASYAWAGNSQVGEGKMTIVESRPNEKVEFKLEFLKPFAATHAATFTFAPEGDKTKVTWAMSGKNNLMSKVMCIFINMDKMVGANFEEGLGSMKTIAEKEAASAPAPAAPAAPTTPAPAPEAAPAPAPSSTPAPESAPASAPAPNS